VTDASVSDKAAAAQPAVAAPAAAPAEKPAPPRSMDEIEAELDTTRERLAERIDELQEYVSPRSILQRQMDRVTGVFVDEYGGIRPDRVLVAAGVVIAVVGIGMLRRRRRR
jgi:hypothetical protein